MKNLALITGASSGIGKELAKIHASEKGDLILVARRRDEMESLADELRRLHGVYIQVVALDLSIPGAVLTLLKEIGENVSQVEILMNNAGFGGFGRFFDRPIAKEIEMMQLNMVALTELTHRILPHMIARGSGKILNTASSAGFMPGPLQSVYFATKAYVVSFTQGIHYELKSKGITVTALCPGPVKTEFDTVAGMGNSAMFANGADAFTTAKKGYKAMMKGKRIKISEFSYTLLIKVFGPILPDALVMRVVEKMQSK